MPLPYSAASMEQPIACSVSAAANHRIPAEVLLAVAEKEGGRAGQRVHNLNGTEDYGPLQFNSAYIASLASYGIRPSHVLYGGCYPYQLAAWRLYNHLAFDTGDFWTRAANFHSRTPGLNAIYREDLIRRADRWREWLRAHPQTMLMQALRTDSSNAATLAYQPRTITASDDP